MHARGTRRGCRCVRVYTSKRALPGTEAVYVAALREAFANGDPTSLTERLVQVGLFAERQNDGKAINVAEAAAVLGVGQFVAYYSRAVGRRSIESGKSIEIYRGQQTVQRRLDSEALIGTRPDPQVLLDELRAFSAEPWRYSQVGKPNSGLAVRLA